MFNEEYLDMKKDSANRGQEDGANEAMGSLYQYWDFLKKKEERKKKEKRKNKGKIYVNG